MCLACGWLLRRGLAIACDGGREPAVIPVSKEGLTASSTKAKIAGELGVDLRPGKTGKRPQAKYPDSHGGTAVVGAFGGPKRPAAIS